MPIDRRMDKRMWHVCTTGYYSVTKNNGLVPFAVTWMGLETVMLSEVQKIQISHSITSVGNLEREYK